MKIIFYLIALSSSSLYACDINVNCISQYYKNREVNSISIQLLEGTNVRTFEQNADGVFSLKLVKKGNYKIRVEGNTKKTGLFSFLIENVKVNENDSVINLNLFVPSLGNCGDQILNASLNQKDTLFYESGKILATGKYAIITRGGKSQKLRNGKWRFYFENGNLKSEIEFENGLSSHVKSYTNDGKISYHGNLRNGCKVGEWVYYKNDVVSLRFFLSRRKSLIKLDFKYINQLFLSYREIFL